MALEIRTAAELIALDVEGRGAARRAARETPLLQRVLRAFVDRAGPVGFDEIGSAFPAWAPGSVLEALRKLDEEDLLRMDAGRIDLAYPFSASPTAFVVDVGHGRGERCVLRGRRARHRTDARRRVRIRSQCHHCAVAMELWVDPSGPGPDADGVRLWVGKRAEDERRACDSL
jgi:hypothetical protein